MNEAKERGLSRKLYLSIVFFPILLIMLAVGTFGFIETEQYRQQMQESIQERIEVFTEEKKNDVRMKTEMALSLIKYKLETEEHTARDQARSETKKISRVIFRNFGRENPTAPLPERLTQALSSSSLPKNGFFMMIGEQSDIRFRGSSLLKGDEATFQCSDSQGASFLEAVKESLRSRNFSFKDLTCQMGQWDEMSRYVAFAHKIPLEDSEWIMMRGVPLESNERVMQQQTIEELSALNRDQTDYFFVSKLHPAGEGHLATSLLFPDQVNVEKMLADGWIDKTGTAHPIGFLSLLQREKKGFLEEWRSDLDSEKMTYFVYYEPWEWVIASGFSLGEIEDEILEIKENFELQIEDEIRKIVMIALALSAVTVLMALVFARGIIQKIRYYSQKAESLNRSLDQKVKEKTLELEELNHSLEDRVKEELEKNRQQEHLMLQQSRSAAMGEMLSMIAHQWRQPLNALSLTAANIKIHYDMGSSPTEEFVRKKCDFIEEKTQQMSETITDFMNFFKPSKGKEPFLFRPCVERVVNIMKGQLEQNRIELSIDIGEDVWVIGVQNEMDHVLLNLIANAQDEIIERKSEKRWIGVKAWKEEDCIVIAVEDSAGGVLKENLGKVFDPYFTTKHATMGTGIGLHMVRTIIERNFSGTISVHNTHEGAAFIMRIDEAAHHASSGC